MPGRWTPSSGLAADGIEILDLLGDPAELAGTPWYLGAASSINLLVWASGAALYLVAGLGLRRSHPRMGPALAFLGLLTIVFTLDDLLLLHEIFLPWVLGLPQLATFAVYGVAFAACVVHYRSELLALPESSLLVIAALALGGSVTLDVLGWDTVVRRVAEEVLKLLGASLWAAFPAALIVRGLTSSRPGATRGGPETH